jgi:hypothetical protein
MRRSTIPVVLFSLLSLAACTGDSPTHPLQPTALPDQAVAFGEASVTRPIRGYCEATYAEPPVFAFPILHHVSTGSCGLLRLGPVSIHTVGQINVVTGVQHAQITYTAPNGDQVFATSVGTGTPSGPTTIDFSGVTTITGGTGRFAGATGVMNATGTVDTATGNASIWYNGWISY